MSLGHMPHTFKNGVGKTMFLPLSHFFGKNLEKAEFLAWKQKCGV